MAVLDAGPPDQTVPTVSVYPMTPSTALRRHEMHGMLVRAVDHPTDGRRYAEAAATFTNYQSSATARTGLFHVQAVYLLYLDRLLAEDAATTPASVLALRRLATAGATEPEFDGVVEKLTAAVRAGVGDQAAKMVADGLDVGLQVMLLLAMFAVVVELVEDVAACRGLPTEAVLSVLNERFD